MNKKLMVAQQACERFPAMSSHGMATMLYERHRGLFNSVEDARDRVRYLRGEAGKAKRKKRGGDIIKKMSAPPSLAEERKPYNLEPGTWLVINDAHVPFHAVRPLEAALKFGSDHGADRLLMNGDMQDCEAVGRWAHHTRTDFVQEIEIFVDFLTWIGTAVDWKQKIYKPGNHEDRLASYYYANAPAIAHQHAQMVDVLGLEQRGFEWLGRKQRIKAGKHLNIIHGHEMRLLPYIANPARWLFSKVTACAMMGHWHTTTQYNKNSLSDTLYATWTVGCMCDLHPDYNPHGNEWNWGFAVVNLDKNGDFEVENRRVLKNGKVV